VDRELTQEEKLTNAETRKHIKCVGDLLGLVIHDIVIRTRLHDQTKLQDPELSVFVKYTPKLKDSTFGSEEYQSFLQGMKPALDHHYAHNPHHPEHFENGINDMTLMDLIEMFTDWLAASRRHSDGDIMKSIEVSAKRFGLSDQVTSILRNTARWFEENENQTPDTK